MNIDNDQYQDSDNKQDDEVKIYPNMLPLTTLFVWFIGILNGKAWEHLGLLMNPETKEIKKDLKKAKISIDSVEFLYNQIKEELEVADRKQIEDILANLQLNYVEKNQENLKPDQTKNKEE